MGGVLSRKCQDNFFDNGLNEGVLVVDDSDKKLESSQPNEFIRPTNFLIRYVVVTLMESIS